VRSLLVVLFLFLPHLAAAQSSLPREPLRTWEILITSLQPLQKIHVRDAPRLQKRLEADEQVADRVHILLERVVGICPDLSFNAYAYQEAFTGALQYSYFPGSAMINSHHAQHATTKDFASAIEPFLQQAGGPACHWFYERLGPSGALVAQFRDFTAGVNGGYRRQVLWTNGDICRRPTEYWAPLRPHPEDIAEACRAADKYSRIQN
jgi:hypothetical protein